MKNRLIQAYKQAPWRVQVQWIGLFLLGLVLIASVAGVYLSISAQAATSGRKIQSLGNRINDVNNEIAVLTTRYAVAQSTEKMRTRAEDLGFVLIDPQTAVYLEVPGYDPDASLVLAPPRTNIISERPIVQSTYRLSLWDWFTEHIWQITDNTNEEGLLP
jgi:hypothetical protein